MRLIQGNLFEPALMDPAGPGSGHSPGVGAGEEIATDPWEHITTLDSLREEVVKCQRCALRKGCRGVVFGEGNPAATLMLIGEGPGAVEDEMGRPFVGPAGQLLDKILGAVGISREEVYIGNVVKCRPPGNRLPYPDEVRACYPHLKAQIRIISPKIIVCLGALAAQTVIDASVRITRIRGQWHEIDGRKVMPTYHPAALLRDSSKKRPVWEDFKAIKEEYEKTKLMAR